MAWNGSGTFSRTDGTRNGATVWAQAKAASVKILAADHDTHDEDIATAINNCLTKDGQNAATGNIDFNGKSLLLDVDADSHFTADTDDRLDLALSGIDLFRWLGTVASPVNGLDFVAAATGNAARIDAQGTDTNVGVEIRGKGTGTITLADAGGLELLKTARVASAVNEVTVQNAATGNAPQIQATGGDTNISVNVVPKGTGVVQIGGTQLAGRMLLATQTASASATLDFTSGIDSTYDTYEFELIDVVPTTADQRLGLRIQESAAFKSGATDYKHARQFTTSTPSISSGGGAAAEITFSEIVGNDATRDGLYGTIRFHKPSSTSLIKRFMADVVHSDAADTQYRVYAGGSYTLNGNAITGVQFLFASGTIASGTIRLYGIN